MGEPMLNTTDDFSVSTMNGGPMARAKFRGRILLLEDDELLGTGLMKQLTPLGIETVWATTVDQAESALKSNRIHAIVSDIYLKGSTQSGLDLVAASGGLGYPIIVITSNANLEIAKKAMNDGASYLLEKPFDAKTLADNLLKLWLEPKNHIGIMERFFELNDLTAKEREITRLLLKGLSNAEIASALKISDKTVKFHLTTIFGKCGVQSRTELYSTILPT
jgi:DNA-binding NarL/FixJ family response regulator